MFESTEAAYKPRRRTEAPGIWELIEGEGAVSSIGAFQVQAESMQDLKLVGGRGTPAYHKGEKYVNERQSGGGKRLEKALWENYRKPEFVCSRMLVGVTTLAG